jgi:hypothetical protein
MHPVVYVALGVLLMDVVLAVVFWRDIPKGKCEEVCENENGACCD